MSAAPGQNSLPAPLTSNEETMRIAATAATLLFAMTACSTTESKVSPYQQPNQLMSTEINQRIEQIPFQHREELVQNLLWLAQVGEQTIPALLTGLNHENPKVRSSCCWVLGRMRDRRTVPQLQQLVNDSETSVRMEACRSLVMMGDLQQSPKLIEGLDSDRKEVRYMCHEALKSATGHDFGYDHLNQNQQELQVAVLRWRQWWGEYAGDKFFASNYEQEHGLSNLAAPAGETKPQIEPQPTIEQPQATIEPAQPAATPAGNAVTESVESADPGASSQQAVPVPVPVSAPIELPNGSTTNEVPPSVPPVVPSSESVVPVPVTPSSGEQSNTVTPAIPVVEVPAATTPSSNAGAGNGHGTAVESHPGGN